jgi:hypothetical protein
LDRQRAFIVAVDEGSYSAAARRLRCAQSAVSDLESTLEAQTLAKTTLSSLSFFDSREIARIYPALEMHNPEQDG